LPSRPNRLDHDRNAPALNAAPSQKSTADNSLARHATTRSNQVSSNVMCASLAPKNAHVTTGLVQRIRPSDVYTEAQVAERHPVYRARLLHGPTHRADIWAALDRDPERSVADVAHDVGCAYASARQVAADWRLARACGVA
jgi:hypothetical protein